MTSRFALAFPRGVNVGKWTREFERRHPEAELVVAPSADPLAALAAGDADMAFVRDAEADDDRHLIPLYAEDVVLVMHHEHLLTLEEKLHRADLDGEPRIDGEPSEAAMRRIAEGEGIALWPASIAKSLRRKDVVAVRLEDGDESAVALTWPREGQHPLVDEFIGIVRGRTAHSSRNPEVAEQQAAAAKQTAPKRSTARQPGAKRAGGSASARSGRGRKRR
ncbi:LysR family transcriptional regulator [Leifsonia sp. LS1]|uniref:LysR substrate-binding domain-containing protein n=1 Tax=Leifsonia sp. LS1 TaxID=2828483 RepID=UPI001CFEA769|nr:LysR substrate-binding domain-containing protein [Leifsonia sp. LS1]GIT82023.1 LysR family transcriptional regulator [Leifsonia sp. LS1]